MFTGYSEEFIDKFKYMSVEEQLKFLKDEVNSVSINQENYYIKADYMRKQLLQHMKVYELFYNLYGDEVFMNETLRDFLNAPLSIKGYVPEDLIESNGWYRLDPPGDLEHQHNQVNGLRNIKYVNIDGREAVFDGYGRLITDGIDKGTFNYGKSFLIKINGKNRLLFGFTPDSTHGMFDMAPFYRQNNLETPIYWPLGAHDSGTLYGWQRYKRGE